MSDHLAGWHEAPATALGFPFTVDVLHPPESFRLPPDLHGARVCNDALFDRALPGEAMRDPDDHGDW
ncbi:hypothetical protein SNE32_17340 [Lysobacter sp. D1-1-M9]|uniref:hypothetical protein n=1 Tax=Novilysobacter longmucuonensis TaxID=3098603 RepID=UPI002FCB7DC6